MTGIAMVGWRFDGSTPVTCSAKPEVATAFSTVRGPCSLLPWGIGSFFYRTYATVGRESRGNAPRRG